MPNIEEQLRKAIEEGKFDNLPGKGKPLHLDDANPYADADWELAYHILKESGFTLPWIETLHEIENDIEAARKELQVAWEWFGSSSSQSQPGSDPYPDWERSQSAFKDKLVALNQRIRNYNLQVPNPRFHRPVLNFEREIEIVTHPKK
jgi:DnaJ homolog subfamily C member 28